eukprot:2357546-Rhodomonas_salina.4
MQHRYGVSGTDEGYAATSCYATSPVLTSVVLVQNALEDQKSSVQVGLAWYAFAMRYTVLTYTISMFLAMRYTVLTYPIRVRKFPYRLRTLFSAMSGTEMNSSHLTIRTSLFVPLLVLRILCSARY